MNEHALGVLEYDKIVAMLVARTSFAPAAELAAALTPSSDRGWIENRLGRVSELRSALDDGADVPTVGAVDIRAAVASSRRVGAALHPEQLLAVASTLERSASVRSFLERRSGSCPLVCRIAADLVEPPGLRERIGAVIDPETLDVRDSASRELRRIRTALQRARTRIERKIQEVLERESAAGRLQEPAVHMRDGRHVLPVRREKVGRIDGIVHDRSSSGATLFVEPPETVALSNELADLVSAERDEVLRILQELTGEVGAAADDLSRTVEALAAIDLSRAGAVLSRDLGAVEPELDDGGRLVIRAGRHPLLIEALGAENVVPLDFELGGDGTTVVISGPNAGGKTVALKTIGVLQLMAQSGLHVPATAGTAVPVLRDCFADIGDEQSIEMSLSTFSSHLRTLAVILREAGRDTLVLIDELGAGTDPDEGGSIALAILEDLTERGAPTVATTHLGSVKASVHNRGGMMNGSMAFDPETFEPSFRYVSGVPGASHALSIAARMGLPDRVLSRANELRDQDAARIDGLVADLVQRERALSSTLDDAEREHARVELLARDYEDRLSGVKDERKKIRGEALAEAREILERAQSLVEETVKDLKTREAERRAIKEARRKIRTGRDTVARKLEEETPSQQPDEGRRPEHLEPGMPVRVAGIDRVGELLDLPDDRGKVRVRIRNASLEIEADELREAPEGAAKRGERPKRAAFTVHADDEPAVELHLRGMTTDEIPGRIEQFLSRAVLQGMRQVRIVHGKGTGALRSRTHEVLRGMPHVASFRLGRWGEGDTGVTIVELD
jgi:DNA mismatch repair protein MutS2